jgi:hypothetical protein
MGAGSISGLTREYFESDALYRKAVHLLSPEASRERELTLLNAAMFAMLTWLIMQSAEYRFKERTELMVIIKTCLDELQRDRGGAQFSSPKMSVPLRKPQSGQVSK